MKSSTGILKSIRVHLVLIVLLIASIIPQFEVHSQSPSVHAVIFTSSTCTYCREIVEQQLPPLLQPFGDQLHILYVDVVTPAGEQLYLAALSAFEVPRGTPQVFIGTHALMGINITEQFPSLVETYLAQGGVDWPIIPGLKEYLAEHETTLTPIPLTSETPISAVPGFPDLQGNDLAPVVRAVLFWMDGCPHCHEVLENVLPPLQETYGSQLEVQLVEVVSMEDINQLYEVAAFFGIPPDQVGVPFLIIGEHVLIGSAQIPAELPGLIEQYLARGGVNLLDIPEITYFFPHQAGDQQAPTPTSTPLQLLTPDTALVQAIMLNSPDCHDCQTIADQVLELARQDYKDQFTVEMIDIITSKDVEYLHQIASAYGISKEDLGLPLIIIDGQFLMGDEIPARLPALIETYLQAGGVELPLIPTPEIQVDSSSSVQIAAPANMRSNGFVLAIVILVLMTAVLIYSLVTYAIGKSFALPAWSDWLIPVLIILGISVAGYLSYVETQSVKAFCGPVGDCNTVQTSSYARLFGVLPIGILGLLGYFALLASWLIRRFFSRMEKAATLAFWGLSLFAVAFSLYLTYLEPFVIKAVCAWCLASSVIVSLLLLLGTPAAVQQRRIPGK